MNNTKPKISIIVPNFNYERYLNDALSSIQNQTLPDWECIVIDDGSWDNSLQIIRKYTDTDHRFRLICQKHSGVSVARNAGLDAARGEYIAFLDADDCYTEKALETLFHLAITSGADIVGGRTIIVPGNFKYAPTRKATDISLDLFDVFPGPNIFEQTGNGHKWAWIWRRLYKRNLIGNTRFDPKFTTLGEDLYFILSIAWRARSFAECANTIIYHRHHPNGITTKSFSAERFNWFPTYVKNIITNLSGRYDDKFFTFFWRDFFKYLITETLIRPHSLKTLQPEGKKVLIECCKMIPRHYLGLRHRILCRFISCLK